MKQLFARLLIAHVLTSASASFAYGIPTHRTLSERAVAASVLGKDRTVLYNLGVSANQQFPNFKGREETINELVKDGAEFEDNLPRPLHHFYDPVNDRPLTNIPWFLQPFLFVAGPPRKSPDWALEDRGDIDKQDSSFKDARLYLYCALTAGTDPGCVAAGLGNRDGAFGLTFQTLGQVIHHLQDMAQPQHVRNDEHALGSVYEQTTDDLLGMLTLGNYGPIRADAARKLWATGDGKGIAEFTATNFVSAKTNFLGTLEHFEPYPEYSLPNGDGAVIEVKEVGDPELGNLELPVDGSFLTLDERPLDGKLYFIGTPLTDQYIGFSGFNDRTSTFSLYDPYLQQYNSEICGTAGNPCARTRATFTLNEFNYKEARQILLPRAIAYSAGLIDYFFRGKLEFCDGETSGISVIKNLSKTEDMKGIFVLYYDDSQGIRLPIAQWKTTDPGMLQDEANGTLAKNGGEMRVTFTPPDPKPETYMLVFYGDLGEEKAPRDADGSILPGGAVVAKQVDTTKHCRGLLWAWNSAGNGIQAYDLPAGEPSGHISPPTFGIGVGVAYDPADGNLWYAGYNGPDLRTSDGKIRKITPDGTPLPIEITVTGTQRRADGTAQRDFAGLAVDPVDPSYLWVAGALSTINSNANFLYKVATRDKPPTSANPQGESAGQVVHTCQVFPIDEPTGISDGNLLLAAMDLGGRTALIARPGIAGFHRYVQVIDADTCAGIDTVDFFYNPSTNNFTGFLLGIEARGNNLIGAVKTPNGSVGVYDFGAPPYSYKTFADAELLFSLPEEVADLALGSDFQ